MNTSKKSKVVLSCMFIMINMVILQSAYAEYVRRCPMDLKIRSTNYAGGNMRDWDTDIFFQTWITVPGSPSNKKRRKLAKKYAASATGFCLKNWTNKAVRALNAGQTEGKIAPPSICKDPENNLTNFHKALPGAQMETWTLNVANLRWAYVIHDYWGFYGTLSYICHVGGSNQWVKFYADDEKGGAECSLRNTSVDFGSWHFLTCSGDRPINLN